jgi:hypothetical protein
MAQSISQFFVNRSPVTDGEDPDNPIFTVKFIDDAKPSDLVFPETC